MRHYNMTRQILRQSILVLSTSLVFACQSLDQSVHIYMQDKKAWQSLADTSVSLYKQHKLIISAVPKWQETGYGRHYQLVDFSFSKPLDQYRINLLSPDFSNKYVCNWYCELLNEVATEKPKGHFTYLSKLYADNESELVNFYEQLIALEDHMLALELPPQTLTLRLMKLQHSTEQFDSLTQVIAHLYQYIDSEQSVFEPVAQLASAQTGTSEQGNDTSSPSNQLLATQQDLPSDEQQTSEQEQSKILLLNEQLVCSYQENFFGRVLEQSATKVAITLLGQAKQIIAGEIINLAPNTLYSGESTFRYLELAGIKVFDRGDIMPCQIDFPTQNGQVPLGNGNN